MALGNSGIIPWNTSSGSIKYFWSKFLILIVKITDGNTEVFKKQGGTEKVKHTLNTHVMRNHVQEP